MASATLTSRFVIPGFNAAQSGYEWSLTAHRHTDFRRPRAGEVTSRVGDYVNSEMLASGSYQAPPFDKPSIALPAGKKPRWDGYDKDTIRSHATDVKDVGRVIRGVMKWPEAMDIESRTAP